MAGEIDALLAKVANVEAGDASIKAAVDHIAEDSALAAAKLAELVAELQNATSAGDLAAIADATNRLDAVAQEQAANAQSLGQSADQLVNAINAAPPTP